MMKRSVATVRPVLKLVIHISRGAARTELLFFRRLRVRLTMTDRMVVRTATTDFSLRGRGLRLWHFMWLRGRSD